MREILRNKSILEQNMIFYAKYWLKMNIYFKIKMKLDVKMKIKCGENRNHGKFKIYFLMVEL